MSSPKNKDPKPRAKKTTAKPKAAAKKKPSAPKRKSGQPPHKPTDVTRKQVEALVACGIRQESICLIIGISEKTLRLHYRKELDTGIDLALAKVAGSLFKKATSQELTSASVSAAIFWLKTRGGWKEKSEVEHSGEIGIKWEDPPEPSGDD